MSAYALPHNEAAVDMKGEGEIEPGEGLAQRPHALELHAGRERCALHLLLTTSRR